MILALLLDFQLLYFFYKLTLFSMKSSKFMIFALCAISFLTFSACTSEPLTKDEALEISAADWVLGSKNAKATLIEYSDFQCPACQSAHPIVKSLHEQFPEDLRIIYRHFPLEYHYQAIPAARAAEAAGKQGKFYEMHDKLFSNPQEWENNANARDTFRRYAQELELDEAKFDEDYDSRETLRKIQNDRSSGQAAGVTGTPSFFLNGEKIQITSFEDFLNQVTQAINGENTSTQPL
jgi:protein-disulfide isomerase